MRAVARAHEVSLSTVQWWCRRAGDLALDRVDWRDRLPITARVRRTASAIVDLVLRLRHTLKETSDLGEYGARAIHSELVARGPAVVPSVRRIRRPPPPPGWYLPDVAGGAPNSTASILSKA